MSGCFSGVFSDQVSKDKKIKNIPNYHSFTGCILSLSNKLDPQGLRDLLECLDNKDELRVKKFFNKLNDKQLQRLILSPLNLEILNPETPERIFEIVSSYNTLEQTQILDPQLRYFGSFVEENKKIGISFFKLFKDAFKIEDSDNEHIRESKKKSKKNLKKALNSLAK